MASLLLFTTPTQSSNYDGKSGKSDQESNDHGLTNRFPSPTRRPEAEDEVPNSQTLTSILGLLETRISVDDEKREKTDRDVKMRRDWMLAAAVIDRLCFIVLIIIFVGGTLIFITLFLES